MEPQNTQDSIPPENALILVAIIPTPRDLEIARVLGWYRIPYRFAPKIVRVDFLAFYQPAVFGEGHSNCIESFAPVRGVELAHRKDIIQNEPDHPRAEEEYYKIQIGNLRNLKEPIPAGKWKRITFLYTTGARFHNAQTIGDLAVHSGERKTLWRSLRERAEDFKSRTDSDFDLFDLDENILIMLGELDRIQEKPSWYLDV